MTNINVRQCDACKTTVQVTDTEQLRKWTAIEAEGVTVADLCEDCAAGRNLSAESADRLGRHIIAAVGELPV